jgi:hypothetical protein
VDKQFQALEVVDILKMIFLEKFKGCYINVNTNNGKVSRRVLHLRWRGGRQQRVHVQRVQQQGVQRVQGD